MSTLAQLRTRVREKIDEDTEAFWSNTLINNALNESYHFYYHFILQAFEGYFTKTSTISFTGNAVGEYSLPTDCSLPNKIRLVTRNLTNQSIPLKYFERFDNAVQSKISQSTYDLPTYRFRGLKIVFEPAPDFSETDAITIEYTRELTDLSGSVDIDSEFPKLAEDCMILRAVIKCKSIEEMVAGGGADSDPFIKDLLTTEQVLKEALEIRTSGRIYVEQFG